MTDKPVTSEDIRAEFPEEKSKRDFNSHLWAYLVVRPLSFYLAPIFIKLGFSATQTTVLGGIALFIGLASITVSSWMGWLFLFSGAALLNTWHILDFVDGNIARYLDEESLSGEFLDWWIGMAYKIGAPLAIGGVLVQSDTYSLLATASIVWLLIALISVICELLRIAVDYKVSEITESESTVHKKKISSPEVLAGAIISINPPLLLLSVILGVLDLWLVGYAVFNVFSLPIQFYRKIQVLRAG